MIGIDIIKIKRFYGLKKDNHKRWNKIFTKQEWDYCFSKPSPAVNLAGIFAAKEAVIKAVGGKYLGRFDLIQISHSKKGAPRVQLKGKIKKSLGVSISHDLDYAIAAALSG